MKLKKEFLVSFIALGLVLTGCGQKGDPSSPTDKNTVTNVAGNGENWPTEVRKLLDLAIDDNALPYYDAKTYDASYDEEQDLTLVTCYNDASAGATEIATYTNALIADGYEIDDSELALSGFVVGLKNLGRQHYIVIQYGTTEIAEKSTEDTPYYAFFLGTYLFVNVSDDGWQGTDMAEWPTAGFEMVLGRTIPQPDFGEKDVHYFAGDNLMSLKNPAPGTDPYLYCMIAWALGSNADDMEAYKTQLEGLGWDVETILDETTGELEEYVGFNWIYQIVIEFFVMQQTGFGEGVIFFTYLNNEDYVWDEINAYPTELLAEAGIDAPAYAEAGVTFKYFYRSNMVTSATLGTYELHFLLIAGTAANADVLYAEALTAAGWTVESQTETDGSTSYLAMKGQTAAFLFYLMDGVPETSTGYGLVLQW